MENNIHTAILCFTLISLSCFQGSTHSSQDLALGKTATQSSTYEVYNASRAVDGRVSRDVPGGHCSHTGANQQNAWWKVDLGQIHRIHIINITYRQDYTRRLSGYYLYITNDTSMTRDNGLVDEHKGHLCYHDTGPGLPSYRQSMTCDVRGRYVIVYNERPADFVPQHAPAYNRKEAFIEICEVQVFEGCGEQNRFGAECKLQCHCKTGDCDAATGICTYPECQDGWHGPRCFVRTDDVAFNKSATQNSINLQNNTDPQNAVNGDPAQCSHTYPRAYSQAWWKVDLGRVYRIHAINVVFTHQHRQIISGYDIYVSNSSTVSNQAHAQEHTCYHDRTNGSSAELSFIQSHPCSVNGRYVIIYNQRPSHGPPLDVPYYSSTEAIVELCDVQVLVCQAHRFGDSCNYTCHCAVGDCPPDTGVCYTPGCQPGWMGDSCSTVCQAHHFGDSCNSTCHCAVDDCHPDTGVCDTSGCQPGWTGSSCSTVCPAHHFGDTCNSTCHCAVDGCHPDTGACHTSGCQPGWTGSSCSTVCPTHRFGDSCNSTCHCAVGGCHPINGVCYASGCEPGWTGENCSIECQDHRFGDGCNFTCHCTVGGCYPDSGVCYTAGCEQGWIDRNCSTVCQTHSFGDSCNSTCHCAVGGCHPDTGMCHTSGCEPGWTGDSCSTGMA